MSNRPLSVSKVFKRIWMYLAVFIIFMAVLSSIFRALTPWAKEYKSEIEQHLSLLIGQPVTIQTIETGWHWFHPVLKLNQVTLGDDSNNDFHINKLLVGINLFKSLWNWQIQPGVLYIDDMHLNLREKDARWTIDGITTNTLNSDMTPEKTKQILIWLSQQEHLIIKHVSAYFYFSDGGLIPVDGLNVSVANSGGYYKVKGGARLAQTNSTDFQLLGEGYFDPEHFEEIKGRFYFSAKNIVPAQWQSLFPQATEHLEGGKGNIALWVDMRHGSITSVQAQVDFKRLAWRLLHSQQSQLIQSFFANLSWKPDNVGWQLLADHIQLRIGGVSWPENQILLKYKKEQQSYQLFVKSIIIESLLSHAIDWPKSMQALLDMKPQGILHDSQIMITATANASSIPPIPRFNSLSFGADEIPQIPLDNAQGDNNQVVFNDYSLNYVLTRFEQLGWNAKDSIPEVHNLSGVVNWQPDQGRLELDSENTSIKVNGYPEQNLLLLNGAFDWKDLNDGLRISMERFVLSQPELTMSMQGAVDQVSRQSIGHIRLGAEFSGKNWQQWVAFLPKEYLKPKLYLWLKNDLKHIAEASGRIKLNGLAKDFPFDNNTGEFTIDSYASGGELAINSKWQVIKEIDGFIHLNKRNLNIDIVHANFQGVPANQMHLRIDDIGKNKENLIVTGKIDASVQKMMNYVMASPLKKKLSLLNMLSVKGSALLNLKVEAPLYPENDTVLAKGNVAFKNNTLVVNHELSKFTVKNLSGELLFNETGVIDSSLLANIFENPMNIKVQSVKQPKPATTITVNGKCTVDSLKNQLKIPVLAFANGSFLINAELKLTDKPSEPDSINLSSSLEGVAIHLPTPLGKEADEKIPLNLTIDFNSKKSMRLRGNYDTRLSADLLFKDDKQGLAFNSGQLRFGSENAVNQNLPGLAVVGSLKGFDFHDWKEIYAQFASTQAKAPLLNKLRIIHVTIDKLSFLKQQFNAMIVKAKILPNQDWSFNLQQKMIAADLVYHVSRNELSGHVQYLHLDKISVADSNYADSLHIHPNQIPNLNLRVDNLSVNKLQIGNVTLKSQSSAGKWSINYCQIDSPVYQFDVQGEWTEKNKINQTKLDVKLTMSHLSKTLERWNVTPAVHAKKGYMEFHGGWKNRVYNFSLASLNGAMYLQLKNGRITHLSKATEEKLGLGKLLSILSLQTIPRRLQLDFSDLSHQGYSFDIFQGNFIINNGIMSTQDSYLNGPVAYAAMEGDLNLSKHTYNLYLKISPHITASLPVVATIAGGPVAGVAAWVANSIISQSMQKISAYSYKISGPWREPVIQQLSMVKKLMNRE
ncbi:transmembrane protein [Legionella gratiana]|uniref:Transmembrane protein n=1 Tax=Legionella gratiana TaxID=45066 RepID=A0A378JD64_9GAMM|nr:YhdP family protein [Legionella gratiana]KTD06601.1 transmembrane protein [Legionella gratiana]STX45565.1 transmembrane protein [Legionella gratiana]